MRPVVVALVLALAAPAAAKPVAGVVFADRDGDGTRGATEPAVKTVVAYDVRTFVETGADGRFTLEVPDDARGIVWARVPDGFVPGPVWTRVDAAKELQLALRPLARRHDGPLTFVVAADTHLTAEQPFANDLGAVAIAASTVQPRPAFFTLLGDITQSNTHEQFDLVDRSLLGLDVPYVPVPGNHDWYDGGEAWFARYGPDNYSFDIGSVHFVVWNMMMAEGDILSYLGAELRRVAPGMTIVALSHAPPVPAIVDRLRELGVDYVLTGHTHTNRVVDHGGLVELTTEPLLMGGLDFMPAGYRIATIQPTGTMTTTHHTVVDQPHVTVHAPSPLTCAPREGGSVLVSAHFGATPPTVTARLDCKAAVPLAHAGGWTWRAALPPLAKGAHTIEIEARTSTHRLSRTVVFEACDPGPAPPTTGTWSQLGGSPTHAGATTQALVPPLAPRWTATASGHLLHGAPAIGGGRVFVAVTDLADGKRGGVVAFDLASGRQLWRTRTSSPVRGGPALDGDTVAIAQLDGTLLVLDAATGALRWTRDLGKGIAPEAGNVFAPPAIAAGTLVLGNRRKLVALDGEGSERWSVDPIPDATYSQSLAAVAIGEDAVVGVFHRELGGVIAWERATGKERWRMEGLAATAINASPMIAGDTVYIVNGLTEVMALDLATGAQRWQVKLDPAGFDWGNATIGTPAIARGILVVPTLYRDLVALDAATGHERWRFAGTPGPLRTTHYRGAREAGFEASPVIAGDRVWAVDTAGRLTAIELESGRLIWEHELGVPALGSLALAGDWLVIPTFDGTVHALTPTRRVPFAAPAKRCDAAAKRGCCSAGGDASVPFALLLLLRRRRRP